ncbi:hypothetical protein MOQ72_37285 [Saccharopolyspora sp. K220]|uniref:hypothetical protein n=1 Tax=Saccharopolyspora soli TaxID=2926618 RepID=UPI001F5929D8|nr:hypothetical protein [Saccharopolyspora soli]MCI2423087.1 hypothetical protein [Saccharopolyspora soli]
MASADDANTTTITRPFESSTSPKIDAWFQWLEKHGHTVHGFETVDLKDGSAQVTVTVSLPAEEQE